MLSLDLRTRPADDLDLVKISLEGVCRTCRHRHQITADPRSYLQQQADWLYKHRACDPEGVLFVSTGREIPRGFDDHAMMAAGRAAWWLDFAHNASVKLTFAASAAITWTLASLATSSTLLAGRESAGVDNHTNLYLDFLVAGKVRMGTSPTTGTNFEVWCYSSLNDTPVYTSAHIGTDQAFSYTTRDLLANSERLVSVLTTDGTSGRTLFFPPTSVASLFGGVPPQYWGLWGVHNTGVALDSTGANHVTNYTPVYATVA